jgi:hypothetical protein
LRGALVFALALTVPAAHAGAHTMPNSTVVVEQVSAQSVRLALAIPLSELAAALGRPADSQADISAELSRYLNQHVSVVSADGLPWLAKLEDMASADGEHLVMVIVLSFTPPPGASSSPARLRYDAINHQVASHYALVYHRVGGKLVPLGRLQSPATTLTLP